MTTYLGWTRRLPNARTIVEGDDYGHFGKAVSFALDGAGRSTAMHYGPHTLQRSDV